MLCRHSCVLSQPSQPHQPQCSFADGPGLHNEYSLRAGIFRENLEKIRQLNLDHNDTVIFDVNHMADWTAEEYKSLLGFRKSPLSSYPSLQADGGSDMPEITNNTSDTADYVDMPDTFTPDTHTVDWRNKGAINALFPLEFQSNC